LGQTLKFPNIWHPRDAVAAYDIVRPLYHAWRHQRDLERVIDRTGQIRRGDILLFSTLRNERWRMPFFLDYYRKLGVRHFLLVDNGSTDGLREYIQDQPDCSLWHTEASYKASNFGTHWMNALLGKYGTGHWCLNCDPDEFLVYPYCESRNLYELTEFLSSEKHNHLFCLMLDMYSRGSVHEAHCKVGQNPLDVAPYFDAAGYVQSPNTHYDDVWIQGGVRRRVFFRQDPPSAPALNKTPLVFWRRHYSYVSSTHVLSIRRLNRPHRTHHLSPTGCLLHFKFLSAFTEKVTEEMERKQHYSNSIEYRRYQELLETDSDQLFCDISVAYKNSEGLVDRSLMNTGQWF
jgi:hypothetical protein